MSSKEDDERFREQLVDQMDRCSTEWSVIEEEPNLSAPNTLTPLVEERLLARKAVSPKELRRYGDMVNGLPKMVWATLFPTLKRRCTGMSSIWMVDLQLQQILFSRQLDSAFTSWE